MINLRKYKPEAPDQWFTVEITPPWEDAGTCAYRFPEFAYIALSEFRLLSYNGPNPPHPPHMMPVEFPTFQFSDDGSGAWYSLRYESGVELEARIEAAATDTVELTLTVNNRSCQYFPGIDFVNCLEMTEMGTEFSSIRHDLKLFWSDHGLESFANLHWRDGRPLTLQDKMKVHMHVAGTPEYLQMWANGGWVDMSEYRPQEEAFMPFLARKAQSSDRYVAVLWPRASTLLSAADIACLHGDVTVPNCPPGETVRLHGCIVLHEGSEAGFIERMQSTNDELAAKDVIPPVWFATLSESG
jgi:hypothetical protein